jgi:hypothetical protein
MALTGDNSTFRGSFRHHLAQTMMDEFDILSPNQYFLFVGKTDGWSISDNVPDTTDTREEEIDTWRTMVAMKSIDTGNSHFMIDRNDWTYSTIYDKYDDNVDLSSKTFFVMTDEHNVYKCLWNNDDEESTIKPTGTKTDGNIILADGYIWKYMYTITPSARPYITDDHIPVRKMKSDGTFIESKNQWAVQQNAADAGLDIILESTNVNFDNDQIIVRYEPNAKTATTSIMGATTIQLNDAHSDSDDAYNGYVITIIDGIGAGQRRIITDYDNATNTITFEDGLNQAVLANSRYEIAPRLVVYGDGVSADAYINMLTYDVASSTQKAISSISVSDPGKYYTDSWFALEPAGVTTTDGSDPVFRGIVSPVGGHGSDAVKELQCNNLLISINADKTENSNFIIDSELRQYGIIKNPLLNDTDPEYLNVDGKPFRVAGQSTNISQFLDVVSATESSFLPENLFTPGHYIIGKHTKATALIEDWGPALSTRHGLLKIKNLNGKFTIPGDATGFGEGLAEISESDDLWTVHHSGLAKVAGFEEVVQAESPTFRCTHILGVSGPGLDSTSFTVDVGVTGGDSPTGGVGQPTGLCIAWTPSDDGTTGELVINNVKGTFAANDYIGSDSYASTSFHIDSIDEPDLLFNSGDIIYLQNMRPITRGAEQREQYQLFFGF